MEMPRKSKDDVFKLEPMSERDPISHTQFQSRLKTSVKKYESEATAATMWLEDQLAPKLNAYQIGCEIVEDANRDLRPNDCIIGWNYGRSHGSHRLHSEST